MSVSDPVAALKGATDFSVVIAWSGAEDKPFYKAMLVSPSRASQVSNEPFWGYAVISPEEFDRVIEVLRNHQRNLAPGRYGGEGPEYYVEVEASSGTYHCSLGFDPETFAILHELANALEMVNRKPIQDIINRVGSTFKGTSR